MIDAVAYNTQTNQLEANLKPEQLGDYLQSTHHYLWVDIENPSDDAVALLRDVFHFDEFAIEDCLHPRQAPKLETFADYHFLIVQGVSVQHLNEDCETMELDCFLGDRFWVTVHEGPLETVSHSKRAVQQGNSRLAEGTAPLAYEMLDHMIDMYLPVLDYFDEKIEHLENAMGRRRFETRRGFAYLAMSRQIAELRRVSVKNQQVFYQLSHSNLKFIDADEARLFKDIYDHVMRVVDMTDTYQHTLRSLMDIHLSLASNQVNHVVQFLTIIATMMLPLNVITGIYGMNFVHLPMSQQPWGFFAILGLMAVVSVAMLYGFRRRGWI